MKKIWWKIIQLVFELFCLIFSIISLAIGGDLLSFIAVFVFLYYSFLSVKGILGG